jgi:hypothetical protein
METDMTRSFAAFVLLLSLCGVQAAQDRPDFSGRWTPVSPDASAQVLVVVQDATSLVAELIDGAATERLRFRFAGTTTQDVAHPDVDVVSTASWRNGAMSGVSTFRSRRDNAVLSVREETWSLDADGRLVIDVTTKRSNGQTSTSSRVFRKA